MLEKVAMSMLYKSEFSMEIEMNGCANGKEGIGQMVKIK